MRRTHRSIASAPNRSTASLTYSSTCSPWRGVEHEDTEDKRERQTTLRNLAFANVALAIDEAVDVIDGECERCRRASQDQLRRMFEDKDYEELTDIESPVEDVDEDELDAEIEELETELERELSGDDE